jgi:hypothetical protein
MTKKKILFLRPFVSDPDGALIVILAGAAIKRFGHLIAVCPPARKTELENMWRRTDIPDSFDDVFEVIGSDEQNWRTNIVKALRDADATVLHVTANDEGFSNWDVPEDGVAYDPATLYRVPLSDPSTGPGLLHEVSFLARMQKMPRTILLCKIEEMAIIEERVNTAQFVATSGHIHAASGRSLIPRLTALDKQLAHLVNVGFVVPYATAELDNGETIASLIGHLRGTVYSALEISTSDSMSDSALMPLGCANEPRKMAPDGKEKILGFTGPEDLVIVPAGELTQVDVNEIRGILSRQGIERGCPYCYAPIENLFFYVDGLAREATDAIRGKCQKCGRRSTVWDDILMDV